MLNANVYGAAARVHPVHMINVARRSACGTVAQRYIMKVHSEIWVGSTTNWVGSPQPTGWLLPVNIMTTITTRIAVYSLRN